jgi:hypothetical protein
MEQPSDAEMHAALSLGPATRLAVIDAFVHRDGTLYLAADPSSIRQEGTVDAAHLRTETSAAGARVLTVHTSPVEVAARRATDVPVPQSYEDVLNAALLAQGDGLLLTSGASWIILAKSEVQSALTRRRRLASKAARDSSAT